MGHRTPPRSATGTPDVTSCRALLAHAPSLGVGSHPRTGLHGAGLVPSAAGTGAGASAQASHPPSRSGWLLEAVILPGSAGRSPGKTAAPSGVSPRGGRQPQAPSVGGWESTLCLPSRVSMAEFTHPQGPQGAALGLAHTDPLLPSSGAHGRVTWSRN